MSKRVNAAEFPRLPYGYKWVVNYSRLLVAVISVKICGTLFTHASASRVVLAPNGLSDTDFRRISLELAEKVYADFSGKGFEGEARRVASELNGYTA